MKAVPADDLIFGVPRWWRRQHSGLPEALADAGFLIHVAGTRPLTYTIVQGWPGRAPETVSPAGTLDDAIAWGMAWLGGQAPVVQLRLFEEGFGV